MHEDSKTSEQKAIMNVARNMCAAARTAPKTCGIDHLYTCILTGDELNALADEMERLEPILGFSFFKRDANNVRKSYAVVLVGTKYSQRGLGKGCGDCNFKDCEDREKNNGVCAYDPLDLGIAIGSMVSIAADARIDNRIFFSAGKAAVSLGILDSDVKLAMGIPLAVFGKSPFFDRK